MNNYSVEIIKPNFTRVDTPQGVVWFSYQTMIAFRFKGGETRVSENYHGPTTGKHINAINPDKKARLKHNEFQAAWNAGPPNPIDAIALAALNGDPIARDLIQDVLDKGGK